MTARTEAADDHDCPGASTAATPPAPVARGAAAGEAPSLGAILGDRRVLIDAAGPPTAFVVASRLTDVLTAGGLALGLAALLVALRLARGQRLRFALGGLAGVAVAAGAAAWTGQAAAYFAPAAALNAVYAVAAVGSVLARRPLVAWFAAAAHQRRLAWFWQPHVRPAYSEITWAWAALFATRAGVRGGLIAADQLEALAVAHVALGLPAFGLLLVATYAYLRWRLPRLRPEAAPPCADAEVPTASS